MIVTGTAAVVYTIVSVQIDLPTSGCSVTLARTLDGLPLTDINFTMPQDRFATLFAGNPAGTISRSDDLIRAISEYAIEIGLIDGQIV